MTKLADALRSRLYRLKYPERVKETQRRSRQRPEARARHRLLENARRIAHRPEILERNQQKVALRLEALRKELVDTLTRTHNEDARTEASFWPWLAGIIDGEGSISITHGDQVCLAISMTHEETIRSIHEGVKTGHFYGPINRARRKPMFMWVAASLQAKSVLYQCLPFMTTKREHASIALRYQSLTRFTYRKAGAHGGRTLLPEAKFERDRLYEIMRKLNRRGAAACE